MGTGAPLGLTRAPGVGPGWSRLAQVLAQAVPPAEIDGLWVFPTIRKDEREWGTAVIARRGEGGRVRVYTGRFMVVARGREKGQGKAEVVEVGQSPTVVVEDVIRGVRERSGETDPPVAINPALWYEGEDDRSAPQS